MLKVKIFKRIWKLAEDNVWLCGISNSINTKYVIHVFLVIFISGHHLKYVFKL